MSVRRYSVVLSAAPEGELDLFLEEFLPKGWGYRANPYGENVLELITDKGQTIGAAASTWLVYDHKKRKLSVKDRGFITGVNGSIEPLYLSPYRMVFYV